MGFTLKLKTFPWARIAVIGAVSMAALVSMVCFQVRQTEFAIVTRFGKPVRTLDQPGLYFRIPWPVDSVVRLDRRLDYAEIRISEALTRDRRNVVLPMFFAWRVDDPLLFLQAVGDLENARGKLDSLITSTRNTVLGQHDFAELVNTSPSASKLTEFEEAVRVRAAAQARDSLGVALVKVGVKRIALPEANTQFVFERMRAERAQFAMQYRAEGRQQADAIRARADAERTTLLAEARKFSEEERGRAEADAARIYSQAHLQDPELYKFLRELETMRQSISTNTTLVLDSNSGPFRQLQNEGGGLIESVPTIQPVIPRAPAGSAALGNASR